MKLAGLALASVASAMLMPMEAEDPYEQTCTGILSYMYAFGNSSCATLPAWNRSGCKCPDHRYSESVINCIYEMITDVADVPKSEQHNALHDSFKAFITDCPMYTMKDVEAYRSNRSSLSPYNESLKKNYKAGEYPVDRAFSLTHDEMSNGYKSYLLNSSSEVRNKKYGAGLLGFWLGVLLIKSFLHIMGEVFPRVTMTTKNSWIPRLCRRQLVIRSNSRFEFMGMSQVQTMIVVAHFVLVIVFCFADLPLSKPNYSYLNQNSQMYGNTIGQRSGVLAMYLLPLLFLFAGRNNFLQWLTGWPINPFLIFHKWIARSIIFLLTAHGIAYSIRDAAEKRYIFRWSQGLWNWGVVGLIIGCFLFIQGLRFFRRRAYDVFLVLHIIGACLFLAAGYWHLLLLEEEYGLYFFYACFAVWGFDRLMRVIRVLVSGPHQAATLSLYDNVLVVTIKHPRHWGLLNKPGSYMFIHFWHRKLFWQSHPFTLVLNPENNGEMKLFCRVQQGATKQIADMVLANSENAAVLAEKHETKDQIIDSAPQMNISVLLDGPYGVTYDLLEFDECVFITGGTGITAPFSYIQSQLHLYPHACQKLRLYWAVRNVETAEAWFSDELRYLRDYSPRVEVHLFGSDTGNRLDVAGVVHDAVVNSAGPLAVMCCGPSSMTISARTSLSSSMKFTQNYVEYFEELFNW